MHSLLHKAVLVAALLYAGLAGPPALGASDDPGKTDAGHSLQGHFLVAHPSLPGLPFAHAVILMIRHDATGAFGLIVNRPLGIAEVTPDAPGPDSGDKDAPAPAREPIRLPAFLGGPVAPNKAFILHSEEYRAEDTIKVAAGVAVTASTQILKDIADGKGPKRMLYIVGYSGWSAGQLEDEIRRNSWYEAPADDDLIFGGEDAGTVWEQALKRRLRGI